MASIRTFKHAAKPRDTKNFKYVQNGNTRRAYEVWLNGIKVGLLGYKGGVIGRYSGQEVPRDAFFEGSYQDLKFKFKDNSLSWEVFIESMERRILDAVIYDRLRGK